MFRLFITIFFLATAFVLFFTKSQPYFNETKELKVRANTFDNALVNSREIQSVRDKLMEKYNTIAQEDIDRLDKLVPSQTDSIKFIIELNDIVKKNGMVLRNIDVKASGNNSSGSESAQNAFEVVSFSMGIAGSYESFYSLLKDLEKDLHLVDINFLKFASGKGNLYEFDIEVSTYWKKVDLL